MKALGLMKGDRFILRYGSLDGSGARVLEVTGEPVLASISVVVPVKFQGEVWLDPDEEIEMETPR